MTPDPFPALAAALGGLALGGAGLSLLLARRERREAEALADRLEYDVVAVSPDLAGGFGPTPLPAWADFAAGVLASPALARFHPRIRADAARFAVEYAGKAVFVRVRRVPCTT
ncbi:MAG: hypothetical protein C0501_26405 [Isosphaera sp.]|nr:hypothetical protein [Isosphaera sp.]